MSLVPKLRSPAVTQCKHCTTVLFVYMHFCLSPPIPPPWIKALQSQELGLVHYHWGFQNSPGQREQSCSVNADWIDCMNLSLPLEKSLTEPAELGRSILTDKRNRGESPKENRAALSLWVSYSQDQHRVVFQKTNKWKKAIEHEWVLPVFSCGYNPTGPVTVVIWAQTARVNGNEAIHMGAASGKG